MASAHPVSGTPVVALTGILVLLAVLAVFAVSFYLYRRSGRR